MDQDEDLLHWSDPTLTPVVAKCLRSQTEPGWEIGARWSRELRDLDLWIVIEGRGWFRYRSERGGSVRVPLVPGIALLARPGGAYEAGREPGHRLVIDAIHFGLADEAGRVVAAVLPPVSLVVPDVALAETVSSRLRARRLERSVRAPGEVSPDAADPVSAALLRGLLFDLEEATAAAAGAGPAAAGPRLHRRLTLRAEARIRERPADPPTVAELAAEAGYSADHFGRIFRAESGRSPQAARIRARVDRAAYLLRSTPMTVSEIAAALGYRDVYFFSRQFKQQTGRSPTAYRVAPAG